MKEPSSWEHFLQQGHGTGSIKRLPASRASRRDKMAWRVTGPANRATQHVTAPKNRDGDE